MLGVENFMQPPESRDFGMMSNLGPSSAPGMYHQMAAAAQWGLMAQQGFHNMAGNLQQQMAYPQMTSHPGGIQQGSPPSEEYGGYPRAGFTDNVHDPGMPASHPGQSATSVSPPAQYNAPPAPPVSPPPQRERFSYTRYQLELLMAIYVKIRYPNSMQKQLIAKRVGIRRDQVKIWFQNRRRKDIVVTKGGKSASDRFSGPRMVPDHVVKSVMTELLKYENDPKGKKLREALRKVESKKKSRAKSGCTDMEVSPPASEGIVVPGPDNSSPKCGTSSDMLTRHSISSDRSSVSPPSSSNYSDISSPSSAEASPLGVNMSTKQGSFTRAVPGQTPVHIQQLDMAGPPNRVAPGAKPQPLARSSSEESLCEVLKPQPQSAPNTSYNGDHLPTQQQLTAEFAPPNRTAPPSNPIPYEKLRAVQPSQQPQLPQNMPKLVPHVPTMASSIAVSPISLPSDSGEDEGSEDSGEICQPVAIMGLKAAEAERKVHNNASNPQLPFAYNAHYQGQMMAHAGGYMGQMGQMGQSVPQQADMFPFPLTAEAPMYLSGYHALQHGCHQDNPMAAHSYNQDPYQPLMISSFQNPYYGYDHNMANQWQNLQDKQKNYAEL